MRDPQDPSEPVPEVVRLMPARAENARALYVINLSASNTPMPLEMPDVRGFFGLAVFRSRRVEDGRDRYRLHLGYFESRADAERALPAVQRRYPTAWIAAAPRSGLGSLDDTNVSEFRLIHSPARRTQPDLTAESATPASEVPVAAPQRYVVQLVWSDKRVDPSEIPQLAIYNAYTMYTVTVLRGAVRYYGIRLGFFTSVISARQIALYVRPEFPGVAVVPVSSREYDVARTIAWHRDAQAVANAETPVPAPFAAAEPPPTLADQPPTVGPATSAADFAAVPGKPEQPIVAHTPSPSAPSPEFVPPMLAGALVESEPPTPDEPLRVVSARLVQSTAAMAPPPSQVSHSAEPAPVAVSEGSAEAPRVPAPGVKSATMKMREESQQRRPAFSREELLAALGANDLPPPAQRHDPGTEPATSYPGPVAKRESALARFLHRLADRLS